MAKEKKNESTKITDFKTTRAKKLLNLYADDFATNSRYDRQGASRSKKVLTSAQVRDMLEKAYTGKVDDIVKLSKQLYATNPIYASVIDYLANMYMWRYKVTPHRVYSKGKPKEMKEDNYRKTYNLMLEVADGLSIETKFPSLLTLLFTQGSLFITTYTEEATQTINTLLLPNKYCRRVAETQYGTSIIEFDFSYFESLSLQPQQLKVYLKSFPKEFEQGYRHYLKDKTNNKWQELDPHFSSGFVLNENSIPTYFYILSGILDFERYQSNEIERSDNSLKYLVVHTMPIYQDQLIFEVDEVAAVHQSLKRVVDTGEKARLITTYGDVHVENIGDNALAEADTLEKSFKAIFHNAGFNSGIFTSDSVEALNMSLIRDKGMVWKYVQAILNFYNLVINNSFDFKGYQADIDILPISPYTYNDDIEVYKENASLGVGKLDYIIAAGTKQKHIEDTFELESFLHLERITPLQSSYTQTAEDRKDEDGDSDKSDSKDKADPKKSGIEPLDDDKEKPVEKEDESER